MLCLRNLGTDTRKINDHRPQMCNQTQRRSGLSRITCLQNHRLETLGKDTPSEASAHLTVVVHPACSQQELRECKLGRQS